MKKNQIKVIILTGLALSGILVWSLTPGPNAAMSKDLSFREPGNAQDGRSFSGAGDWRFFPQNLAELQKQMDLMDSAWLPGGDAARWPGPSDTDSSERNDAQGGGGGADAPQAGDLPKAGEAPGTGGSVAGSGTGDAAAGSGTGDAAAGSGTGGAAADAGAGGSTDDAGTGDSIVAADLEAGYLILVNKQYTLNRDYKPSDLRDILYFAADRDTAGRYLRKEAADAFHALVEDAAAQGVTLALTTGYRSYGFQSVLYNNYVAKDGQAAADRYSARPGTSEHQTGLAADVSAPSVNYRLTQELENTDEGRWLWENASRFGFILRYLDGKEAITGYLYEPWHIRYVGNPAAEYIMAHGLTLEEYLQLN